MKEKFIDTFYDKSCEFLKYFNFLIELVKRDFKKKYYKSIFGVLWTILNPLLMMTVISIIFSTLFKRNIVNFPVYYLTGYVLFNFCSTTTRQALHGIIGNATLIRKIYVPKYMFVLSIVAVQFITLLFSLIPLGIIMAVMKVQITPYILLFPIAIAYTFIFTTGLSLILSSSGVFFRDLDHLYGIIITVWMYATPIFYPISIVSKKFLFIWELNPLYIFITIGRNAILDCAMPSSKMLVVATIYSVLTLITGIAVFDEQENKFMLHT